MKFSEMKELPPLELTATKRLNFMATMKAWAIDEDENGIKTISWEMLPIYKMLFTLEHLYDIEMDTMYDENGEPTFESMIATYDAVLYNLDHFGLWDLYADVDFMLKQEVEVCNSLGVVVGRELKRLVDKIPDMDIKALEKISRNLGKEMAKLSPENKDILSKALDKK